MPLDINSIVTRAELIVQYGGQRQGRIITPRRGPYIFLFSDPVSAQVNATTELVIYLCTRFTGQPTLGTDHDALRWVHRDTLTDLAWLPADQRLLPTISTQLTQSE